MARKQVKKATTKKTTAKPNIKPQATKSHTHALEKEFRDIPNRLIAQCQKDASALNKQDKQIKAELKKADAQKKLLKTKQAALQAKMKTANNASNKKQLNTIKQDQAKIEKNIVGLQQQLAVIKTQSKMLSNNHSKFSAITKLIAQFDKQWAAKERQAAKAVAKPRKKTRKSTAQSAPHVANADNHHSSEYTSIAHDHMQESEMVETAE